MRLIVKCDWPVQDGLTPQGTAVIPTGTHEVERIPNPRGRGNDWIVLKSTQIGAGEVFWRQWEGAEWGEAEVRIEE